MIDNRYVKNDDYMHQRIFHSIAIRSSKIGLKDIVKDIVGAEFTSNDENKEHSKKWIRSKSKDKTFDYEIFLTKLSAPIDFALGSQESEKSSDDFKYYIYFLMFPMDDSINLTFISSPFLNMARYLCDSIRDQRDHTRGKGIYFQKFNIDRMIQIIGDKTVPKGHNTKLKK